MDGAGLRITSSANYTTAVAGRPAFNIHTGWARVGAELTRNQNLEPSCTRQSGGLTLYPALQMDSPYDNTDRINANWSLKELTGLVKQVRAQPTAGYALLGLKAGIHHQQWNFSTGVDNLANRFYFEHLSSQRDPFRTGVRIPEPGRTFYLNLSKTFE